MQWSCAKERTQSEAYLEPTIIHNIFETESSFYVKWRTTGKVSYLFFKSFLLALTKFSFWQEDWALGYYSLNFMHFRDIS